MSRSKKQRSIPNQRGRRNEMKAKRLSHKRVRRLPLSASFVELKVSGDLNRETVQSDR